MGSPSKTYIKWQYGNEIFNVPDIVWLRAFLGIKQYRRLYKDQTYQLLDFDLYNILYDEATDLSGEGLITIHSPRATRPFGEHYVD